MHFLRFPRIYTYCTKYNSVLESYETPQSIHFEPSLQQQ